MKNFIVTSGEIFEFEDLNSATKKAEEKSKENNNIEYCVYNNETGDMLLEHSYKNGDIYMMMSSTNEKK